MAPMGGGRKYVPLTAYLAALPVGEVTLTLAEIEQIVGAPLPPSASKASFWVNRRKGLYDDCPWVLAGWRTIRTALVQRPPMVTFVRVLPDTTA